jgi:cell wall-associated NlpC family hydrolase
MGDIRTDTSQTSRPWATASRVTKSLVLALFLSFVLPPAVAAATGTASTSTSPSGSAATTAPTTTPTTAPSTSTTGGTGSSQSSINATESQAASLEAQISQQQVVLDQTDEQYNQAVVNLTQTQASLQTTTASLGAAKSELEAARSRLRGEAIGAYENDSTSSAVAALFAAPNGAAQTRNVYEGIGADDLAADVARVQAGQRQLSATQAKLLTEQQAETQQLTIERQAQQRAAAANAQSEATLAEVKGALALQIAQQAAAQATAAAQAAANASSPAAAEAAAAQSAQAAQVASTLSGGSAAAVGATTAANQAAGSAAGAGGDPSLSSGGSPQAAGLAAVHGAMKYLGVPYVWGGESFSGVDCSGLTALAWANAGVSLPHSAADQYAESRHVPLNQLEPGDLLFYNFDGSGIDHVVMYVGPTLDGQPTAYGNGTIIQAAHTGTVVTFDPVWYQGLVGAARP